MTAGPFDTETMAELHAAQGRTAEALAIYRRLLDAAPDDDTRVRRARRVAELGGAEAPAATSTGELPFPTAPGVTLARRGDDVAVAWALPDDTDHPALQVFSVIAAEHGVEARSTIHDLESPRGRMTLALPGLRRAAAAIGTVDADGRFAPLAHATAEAV